MMEITQEEKKAINALKRIAKVWPDSLWLFSASGSLCVMKTDENGHEVRFESGGVDPDYIIDNINIPNDGGDW